MVCARGGYVGEVVRRNLDRTPIHIRRTRVVRARADHPRPDTVKVTKEALNNIKVGPWNPSEVITQGSGGKPSPVVEETQPPQAEEPVPRSFRITLELLGKFDYTKGCPKCEALRRGDEHKTVHNSRECRKRLDI